MRVLLMLKFFRRIKNYITEDLIVTFITLFISVFIELIKQIHIASYSAGELNFQVISAALKNFATWRPLVNVALITVILWFIIGISKLLNKQNSGRKALLFTMLVFIVAILAIIWYVIEAVYVANTFTTMCGAGLAILLFLLLIVFLSNKQNNISKNDDTNNIIAAEPGVN